MDMPRDMEIDVWNSGWFCMVVHVRYMLFSIFHDFLFMTQNLCGRSMMAFRR